MNIDRTLTPTQSSFENEIFCAKEFSYMIFDLKNGCKNEFTDKNEKSCC